MQRLKILHANAKLDKIATECTSILSWENKFKSTLVLFLYTVAVYIFQPWMIPFAILLVFLKNWITSSSDIWEGIGSNKRSSVPESPLNNYDDMPMTFDDFEDGEDNPNDDDKKRKTTIRQYFIKGKNISLKIQQILENIAHFSECVRNIVQFKVPFLSWIVVGILIPLIVVLYFIPLRYIIMVVGVDEILKGLIRPNSEGFFLHMANFLSKVPDNEDLKDWEVSKKPPLELNHSSLENTSKGRKPRLFRKRSIVDGKANSDHNLEPSVIISNTIIKESSLAQMEDTNLVTEMNNTTIHEEDLEYSKGLVETTGSLKTSTLLSKTKEDNTDSVVASYISESTLKQTPLKVRKRDVLITKIKEKRSSN